MVSVKVIPEKGVEYSVYEKNGKHRVYFKVNNGSSRPLEVGNYDIVEGQISSPQEAQPLYGISVEKDDNPQALIVIGDSKQIFVGKSASNTRTRTVMGQQHGMAETTTTIVIEILSVVCVLTTLPTLLLTTLRIMLWMMPKSLRPSWN